METSKQVNKEARRGRPLGYRMSQESKDAISVSRTGYRHSEDTKKRISDGVRKFHLTGIPIEILREIDLSECGSFNSKSGYVDVVVSNPEVGAPSYKQRMHVAIIEQLLDRKLRGTEEIHHRGEKDDNRICMLSLCRDRKEHRIMERVKRRTDRLFERWLRGVDLDDAFDALFPRELNLEEIDLDKIFNALFPRELNLEEIDNE